MFDPTKPRSRHNRLLSSLEDGTVVYYINSINTSRSLKKAYVETVATQRSWWTEVNCDLFGHYLDEEGVTWCYYKVLLDCKTRARCGQLMNSPYFEDRYWLTLQEAWESLKSVIDPEVAKLREKESKLLGLLESAKEEEDEERIGLQHGEL